MGWWRGKGMGFDAHLLNGVAVSERKQAATRLSIGRQSRLSGDATNSDTGRSSCASVAGGEPMA